MGRRIASHVNLAVFAVAAVAIVVVSLLSAIPSAAAATPRAGGWSTVKNAASDQHVADLASFAVDAYNKKQKARLRLISVESARSQVGAGTKWSITLQAVAPAANTGHIRINPPLTTYVTEVFEKPTAAAKQPTGVAHLAVQPFVQRPVVGDGQSSGGAQPAVGDGQPAGVAQPVGDGQTSGGAQPVGGGQTLAVKQPALADSLKLVSFAKKK
ncbi:unnamed protein product [Closterium sp. NIES-65]|nr:unnamed protein product [Closterium sp. NIES-65]CAI6007228.1 unnamed protein product [Closterium sp. NIES-65]